MNRNTGEDEQASSALQTWGARGPEEPCGLCSWCEELRPEFDDVLHEADVLWHRYQQPGRYLLTAGHTGLHRTTCSWIRRRMPSTYSRPEGDAYLAALQRWAHSAGSTRGPDAWERYSRHLQFAPMTMEEARNWIASMTSPRGARNYNLCKLCKPAVTPAE